MPKLPLLMKITCYMLHVPSSDFPWSPAPFSFPAQGVRLAHVGFSLGFSR